MKDILDFSKDRALFYIDTLHAELQNNVKARTEPELTSHRCAVSPMQKWKAWTDEFWREYDFVESSKKDTTGEQEADQESEMSIPASVSSLDEGDFQEFGLIRHISERAKTCCYPEAPEELNAEMRKMIIATYHFQRDLKNRVALASHLVRDFGLSRAGAARARRALLFLCRFHAAATTFTRAAREIGSFQRISLVPVTLNANFNGLFNKVTIADCLRSLSTSPLKDRDRLLQRADNLTSKKNADFIGFRSKQRHIHAEIQLLSHYEQQQQQLTTDGARLHRYIGGSKLCCYLCTLMLKAHNVFDFRGSHSKISSQWAMPEFFHSQEAANIFERGLKQTFDTMKQEVVSVIMAGHGRIKAMPRPDSTVDLSTAATDLSSETDGASLEPRLCYWRLFRGYVCLDA